MAKPKKEVIAQGIKKDLILEWECGECKAKNIVYVDIRNLVRASLDVGSFYGDSCCSCSANLELEEQKLVCAACKKLNKVYPE